MDTAEYLLRNKKRLSESIKQIERGEVIKVTLEELMSDKLMQQKYIQFKNKTLQK
ncbi:MAG: hypothetical protein H7339_08890 [Arcicella sp.]|nr:hypothetical protein [Arcicella sp.]